VILYRHPELNKNDMNKTFFSCLFVILFSCNSSQPGKKPEVNNIKIGIIERLDPALDAIIDTAAQAEIISEGYEWTEGPLWIESQQMLLFSDVPRDTVFKWTEEKRKEVYLTPSGYTDTIKRRGETGSNGLLLDQKGNLVLCQCGNRQMAKMDAPLDKPAAKYVSLADHYKGKKFNSPNDAVYNSAGELFFTDPPYGLEKYMDDPLKEIPFQGVYKVKTTGEVVLVTDSLTRPNGIAFLPGEKTLLVANSDPAKPNWYAFDIGPGDTFTNARIFYSAAGLDKSLKGLPDGMKVDKNGNVFATGPGGVWIFNKEGKVLGKIKLQDSSSNCAFSADEKTLFITNDMYVLRLKMRK
jgi:gluconolactonase